MVDGHAVGFNADNVCAGTPVNRGSSLEDFSSGSPDPSESAALRKKTHSLHRHTLTQSHTCHVHNILSVWL